MAATAVAPSPTPTTAAESGACPALPSRYFRKKSVEDPGAPVAPSGDLGVDFAEDDEVADEEEGDDLPFIDDEEDDFDEEIEGLPGEKADE